MSDATADPLPVARPYIWGNEEARVLEVVRNGWLSSIGPMVDQFERSFAAAVGVNYAVSACNGTAALHLALASLGIGPGDEVIVPDFTMIAPIFAVCYCGAIPVPVDIDDTWNLDVTQVEERITPKTKGILAVHTYGHPARVDELQMVARDHKLDLIEDAAEALGATINGKAVGTFGCATCYSFYANKVITTGEGGMLTTDQATIARAAGSRRNMCFGLDPERRFEHERLGFNYRMSSIQAAVGIAQLEHLNEAVERKIAIADRYNRAFAGWEGLQRPPAAAWVTNVYWAYAVLINPFEFGVDTRAVQRLLARVGIESRPGFTPVHRQPFLSSYALTGRFPNSTRIAEQSILLPSFVGMTDRELDRVIQALDDIRRSRLHD